MYQLVPLLLFRSDWFRSLLPSAMSIANWTWNILCSTLSPKKMISSYSMFSPWERRATSLLPWIVVFVREVRISGWVNFNLRRSEPQRRSRINLLHLAQHLQPWHLPEKEQRPILRASKGANRLQELQRGAARNFQKVLQLHHKSQLRWWGKLLPVEELALLLDRKGGTLAPLRVDARQALQRECGLFEPGGLGEVWGGDVLGGAYLGAGGLITAGGQAAFNISYQ